MSSPKELFKEALAECHSLNEECVLLSNKLYNLVQVVSEGEVEITLPQRVNFKALSKKEEENIFILRVEGETQRFRLKNLKNCFSYFENPLKTCFPEYKFSDLGQELKVYNLLKSSTGLEIVVKLRSGLREVKEILVEELKLIQMNLGMNQKLSELVEGKTETFFKAIEEPFSRKLSFQFEVELIHERALLELENFQFFLIQHFEKVVSEQVLKEIETRRQEEIEERLQNEKEGELAVAGFQVFKFPKYESDKLVEADIYFSNKNFKISGRCRPSVSAKQETSPSSLWNNIIFGQERSCYGDQQFRLMVVTEGYLAVCWASTPLGTRGGYQSFENGARHFDGNRFIYELESYEPLKINEWNKFVVEKQNDKLSLTLNGLTRTVEVRGMGKAKYPPHVPFRVGSRFPPKGDSLDLAFRGEIEDFKIELSPPPS
eukprot:TRINITY_DN2845_c0_g1_i1.p1 TRINITY_DN2845_c0_g1~~TRINITY_DN2845_c0_g1_i1.p1  ORF type:complete len:432 (-),score=109.17 TRINITY_DN2845_c0_g1_i1:120-1415(-)